jgi:hypothetical protein
VLVRNKGGENASERKCVCVRVCDKKRGRIRWKKNRKSVIEKERETDR